MDITQAEEVIDRIGGDNPPSREELDEARLAVAAVLAAAKDDPAPDLESIRSFKEAYDSAVAAIAEADEAAEAVQKEVSDLLDGVELPEANGDGDDDSGDEDNGDDGEDEVVEDAKVPVAASHKILPLSEAVARVRDRQAAPTPDTPTDLGTVEYTVGPNESRVETLDMRTVGDTFAKYASGARNKGKTRMVQVATTRPDGWQLTDDMETNTRLVDAVMAPEAVAAAGGCCFLPQTIDAVPVPLSNARPVRDSLPSFGVQGSGAVQFLPPVCLPWLGVGEWTCADDAAVDPDTPATWKDCPAVECDERVEEDVDAIYRCLEIGNFQQRFSGMRWEQFIATAVAQQARVAERLLLSKMILATTTQHTADDTGSVYASLLHALALASADIRATQRMGDVMLRAWVPEWVRYAIKADLIARTTNSYTTQVETDQAITTAARNLGVEITWTPDIWTATAAGVIAGPPVQTNGPLTAYPTDVPVILTHEGFYGFLDGGELNLGTEIRDHTLNRQNSLAAFAETFEGLVARGCVSKFIEVPNSVCGIVPCGEPS